MTKVSLNNKFLISFGMLAVFCMLVLRNFGLAPTVFGDEYVQSMHSRFFEPIEFTWPNFLYFRIFSVTSLFGDNYLEAVSYTHLTLPTICSV